MPDTSSCALGESEIDEKIAVVVEFMEPSLVGDVSDNFSARQLQSQMFWIKLPYKWRSWRELRLAVWRSGLEFPN